MISHECRSASGSKNVFRSNIIRRNIITLWISPRSMINSHRTGVKDSLSTASRGASYQCINSLPVRNTPLARGCKRCGQHSYKLYMHKERARSSIALSVSSLSWSDLRALSCEIKNIGHMLHDFLILSSNSALLGWLHKCSLIIVLICQNWCLTCALPNSSLFEFKWYQTLTITDLPMFHKGTINFLESVGKTGIGKHEPRLDYIDCITSFK